VETCGRDSGELSLATLSVARIECLLTLFTLSLAGMGRPFIAFYAFGGQD